MKLQKEEKEDIQMVEDVVCSGRSGVALCERRALVSHDSSFLLVPSGSCIRVFSLASGEPIRTLFNLHDAFVIAVCPSPQNRVHVLSCSVDGVVARWDSTDFALISKNRIAEGNTKIQVFLTNRQSPWCVYVCHEKANGRAKNTMWLRSLSFEEEPRLLCSNCSSNPNMFGIAANTDLVAWIDFNHQLQVTRCSSSAAISLVQRQRGRPTCVAVHPTDELVAVGDQDGAILIYSGPFSQTKGNTSSSRLKSDVAPAMKLHWHTMPVADLHLSGNFIYSVGAEGVFVRWDLESEERQFLPRLGMPIKHLAVAHNEKYAVCAHTDNTLTVVKAPNVVHRVIQGLVQRGFTGGGNSVNPSDLPMLVDPRRGLLVLSGRPGQLQFYNLEHERQASVLDVTGENLATDFKLNYELKRGINSEVVLADFSPDGRYLATVEVKTALSFMCKLKFWRWNDERGELEADTTALWPHLQEKPQALRMGLREGRYFCVSAGQKSFKLWTLVRGETDEQLFWQSVDERSYRQLQCRALALSEDNSLLAAAFGHIVTLWHINLATDRCQNVDGCDEEGDLRLIGELCLKGNTQEICALEFGRGECNTVLVCASARFLTAWDIVSLDRLWFSQVAVRQLMADPASSNMAALIHKASRIPSSLVIFRPDKAIEAPLAQVSLEQEDQIRCVVWVKTTQDGRLESSKHKGRTRCPQDISWQAKSILLAMGKRDKLFHFVRRQDVAQNLQDDDQLQTHQRTDVSTNVESLLSPFGVHLSLLNAKAGGSRAVGGRGSKGSNENFGRASQRVVDRLLQIPTHVTPSANVLAEAFIKALWLDKDAESEDSRIENGFRLNGEIGGERTDIFDTDDSDDSGSDEIRTMKKPRISAESNKVGDEEPDTLEVLEGEIRAEKVRLPKLKDYEWLPALAVKSRNEGREHQRE